MGGGDREPRRRADDRRERSGRGEGRADDRRERSGRGEGRLRELEPSINLPHALWRKDGFRAGRERYDMATFVKAAAACDIELNEFILQTGNSPAVMDKLHQILGFGFNVKNRTFQEIALPLMALVTSIKFTLSPHTTDVKKILRTIHSHPLFFVRVRNCIQCETTALMSGGHYDEAVTHFAALLRVIVQKIPNAAVDDDMFDLATGFLAWLVENETNGAGPARKSLRDTLEVCMEFVPSRRPMASARPNYLIAGVQTLHGRKKLADTSGDRAFDLGPRHDNDDADFREVKVIPTDLEMRCLEPSYLPHQLPPNAGMEAHLELHFRLLREDVLAQIKRGVQWLFSPQTLRRCVETQNWTPPREQNVPRFNVALNVRLAKVKGSIHKGIMFVIEADQPPFRKGATTKDLKAFWEREQRYQVGSLVCIACDVQLQPEVDEEEGGGVDGAFPRFTDLAAKELIFATVCENNIVDFTKSTEFFSVSLKLIDTAKTANHIALLTKQNHQNVLIEVRGLFFPAYEPILHALQAHDARSLSEELQQGLFGDAAQQSWKSKPPYAAEMPTYNLQFLVKKDCGRRVDLSGVPIGDFEQLAGFLRPYEQQGCLTLDGSQVEAFAAALTQQVCLIQGPPGTGKSYVGTKIVRALLEQRRLNVGPILCVCYTNHALDQFLEDLVKDGLPVDSIVRMGGRSKSEMFQDRSLHVINKDTLSSRQENQRFGALKRQCCDMDEFLNCLVNEKSTTGGPSKASFFQWVETRYPDEYAQIVGSEDADGFVQQGQGNKDRATRWKAWEKGTTRPCDDGMWAMSAQRRQSLVAAWHDEWEAFVKKNMATNLDQFNECVAQAEEVNNARSLRVLQAAKIVGITTTGAAKYHALLRALAPKVVVCEEAGEVLEAHLLSCLTPATEQLIQIGDHMQLRPILNEYTLSYESKRGYNLDVSMFERLVGERTDTESGLAKVPGSLVTLHVQRRMRPEICDLIRFTLYPSLCDGPQVLAYPGTTRGFTDNLWFLDHDHPENSGDLSCKNSFEAELVVELVAHAIRQGYGLDDITILTPYLGQLVLIRQLLQGKNFRVALDDNDVEAIRVADMDEEDEDDDAADEEKEAATPINVTVKSLREFVRLSTVDNFQGNESNLVFISTVRNNDSGRTGFLKTFNRVNVMLSRAKCAMYVLGSAATIRRSAKATMFNGVLDILEDKGRIGRTLGLRCQNHGTVTQIATASDIQRLTPDGGCLVPCDRRLNCGHSCPKACHADDPRHVAAKCLEPCVKRVAACGHLCTARCYERCRCSEIIDCVQLECGHARRNVRCTEVHGSSPLRCTTKVTVSMPFCGHPRTDSCAFARHLQRALDENDEDELWKINLQCRAPCGSLRPACGHACEQPCRGCLDVRLPAAAAADATLADMKAAVAASTTHMQVCPHKCDRQLFCGHNCASACHPAGSCPPCDAPCRNLCSHSACSRRCKDPCASCADPCPWSCPHMNETCKLPCGSPCTRLPCDKRCTNELECGHQCPGLCGEPCLSSDFCRQCPPRVATERSQVVDLIMGTTLQDHDPDESPLVRLRCGHCFTIETMDGCVELAKFYETDGQGQWVGVKPLEPPAQGGARYTCPTCRAPVGGVRRYGRLVNFSQLMVSELKYLQATTAEIALSKALRTTAGTLSDVKAKAERFRRLVASESPSQEVCTKESSRLARLGFTGDSLNLTAFRHVMSSQPQIMLSLELLELLALVVQTMDKAPKGKNLPLQFHAIYHEGLKLEKTLREMCRREAAHRSANEAVLGGMKLRVAYQKQAEAKRIKNFSKEAIVRELRNSLGVLAASTHPVPATMLEQARHLVKSAEEFGTLTKAEKDAIFKLFETSKDVYAQGFGGHWYQCPSGHPYVITECGGAMEEAKCPECGAAIGGSSHRLNATNTTAERFFAQ